MNASEMIEIIGKPGYLFIESLVVAVKILNVRNRFGSVDYLVTPIYGKKEQWVSSARVELTTEEE